MAESQVIGSILILAIKIVVDHRSYRRQTVGSSYRRQTVGNHLPHHNPQIGQTNFCIEVTL